ncbi:MAG: hypothetical protein ACJ789_17245 [Thermomicrobiales bacterium]
MILPTLHMFTNAIALSVRLAVSVVGAPRALARRTHDAARHGLPGRLLDEDEFALADPQLEQSAEKRGQGRGVCKDIGDAAEGPDLVISMVFNAIPLRPVHDGSPE